MYNLIVVDDEPLILESLYKMVERERGGKFYVHKASSAKEALEIFENVQINVLMTDIRMPQIDGIQLRDIVSDRWTDCLTIFLTGQENFQYAKEAVNENTISFVLKTEGDEAILLALDKIYARLDEIYEEKAHVLTLTNSLAELKPVVKHAIIDTLLFSEEMDTYQIEKMKMKLSYADIRFELDKPFLLATIRLAEGTDTVEREEIRNVFTQTLGGAYVILDVFLDDVSGILLAQSDSNNPNRLKGFIEIGYRICEKSELQIPDFFIFGEPVTARSVDEAYRNLNYRLYELDESEGIRIISQQLIMKKHVWKERVKGTTKEELQRLDQYLLHCDEEKYIQGIEKILFKCKELDDNEQAVTFSQISSRVLGAIMNYLPEDSDIFRKLKIDKLTNYCSHQDFCHAIVYCNEVAHLYFKKRREMKLDTKQFLVNKINKYIDMNIGEDLSLVNIGYYVGMNSTYTSRVYKEVTGNTLNHFIAEKRIDVAKSMLEDPFVKMTQIANAIGLHTSSHFTHFFKKHTGYTPQEYRKMVLQGENR